MSYYSNRLKNYQTVDASKYTVKPEEHKTLEENYDKLQKLLLKEQKLREEISLQKEELIKDKYEPYNAKICVYYPRCDVYYDFVTGIPTTNEGYDLIVEQEKIDDALYIPLGTDLEHGAIIYGIYNSKINSQKGTLKKVFSSVEALDIEKIGEANYYSNLQTKLLKPARDFFLDAINRYYDFNYRGYFSPAELMKKMQNNKSSEIIIKEVDDGNCVDKLLCMNLSEAKPINKILKLTRPMYLKIKENGLLELAIGFSRLVDNLNLRSYITNENDIYDFLAATKDYISDAEFYSLNEYERTVYTKENTRQSNFTCSSALYSILNAYKNETIRSFYTFKKFYMYVYKEVVNQGYKSSDDLVDELKDYLLMCKTQNVKPNTNSSSLTILHNITSRNHKIIVKEHEEEIFKTIYENDKHVEKLSEGYMVVTPSCTNDVKQEGDSLCHCVASYIKRILNCECKIYFLRQEENTSLITFEVKDGDVVQVRGSHNRAATPLEMKAINEWCKKHEIRANY